MPGKLPRPAKPAQSRQLALRSLLGHAITWSNKPAERPCPCSKLSGGISTVPDNGHGRVTVTNTLQVSEHRGW